MSALAQLAAAIEQLPPKERNKIFGELPPAQREEIEQLAVASTRELLWVPNTGPQTAAYFSEADELLFGGEAGGGKSDVLLGLALNNHKRSRILRRINQDVAELGDRLLAILGTNDGYSSHPPTWRRGDQILEMRGCEFEKDKQRYKGRARDFIGYDELSDFLESQYVFINTWNRSTDPDQRCRIVGATNGPTTAEGQWVIRRWAAWLDPSHPKPAKDGELRWYLTIGANEIEVDGPGPHPIPGRPNLVRATSRSFIRSRLEDNPDLDRTDYGSRLEGLPEELRRVYRDGDFTVGLQDDAYQVIPTAWIEAAMQRWEPNPPRNEFMTAIAVDVAQGGPDQTVLAHRYGGWFGPLDMMPGEQTRDGKTVASMVVKRRRANCPVVIDVGGGYGADAIVAMKDNGIPVTGFNGVNPSIARDRSGKLKMYNKRAESYWKMREELDPEQEGGSVIALPRDPLLKADLAAPHWQLKTRGVLIEDKADIKKRLGRSPDRGDAVTMCLSEGNRAVARAAAGRRGGSHSGRANLGNAKAKTGPAYGGR